MAILTRNHTEVDWVAGKHRVQSKHIHEIGQVEQEPTSESVIKLKWKLVYRKIHNKTSYFYFLIIPNTQLDTIGPQGNKIPGVQENYL